MLDHDAKMLELGVEFLGETIADIPERIAALETAYRLTLPSDYKRFLSRYGETTVAAEIRFREPVPFAEATYVHAFHGFTADPDGTDLARAIQILEADDDYDGDELWVPIASNIIDTWYFLVCDPSPGDYGRVLMRDRDQRHSLSDATLSARWSGLALPPSVAHYLELRGAGTLPPPLSGRCGWYLVGTTFDDFLASCRRSSR